MTLQHPDSVSQMRPKPAGHYVVFKDRIKKPTCGGDAAPVGLQFHAWRPTLFHPLPEPHMHNLDKERQLTLPTLLFFYLDAMARQRTRASYTIEFATNDQQAVCGYAVLKNGDFRFPFMSPDDVQLGPLWVSEGYRGKGLAIKLCRLALLETPDLFEPAQMERNLWWLCLRENEPSRKVAAALGLALVGTATRNPLFHLRKPSVYRLDAIS